MDTQNSKGKKKPNKNLKMVFLLTPRYSGRLIILLQGGIYFDHTQFLLKSYISSVPQCPELQLLSKTRHLRTMAHPGWTSCWLCMAAAETLLFVHNMRQLLSAQSLSRAEKPPTTEGRWDHNPVTGITSGKPTPFFYCWYFLTHSKSGPK